MNTSNTAPSPIKSYSLEEITQLVKDLGQPAFRAQQLIQWLYVHHVSSYDDMTNLPASLRTTLAEQAPLFVPEIVQRFESADGTRKYLLRLYDGSCVESVAIPSRDEKRLTVCFSTQVGCAMDCSFCATGKEGLTRNLLPGEIVDQVLILQEDLGTRVTNAVGMGQGEPFLNYENTLAALHILNNPKGLALGARHISVSTCGIIPGIKRFAEEPEQFTLAVSLHSAIQEVRDAIMPRVVNYSLPHLKKALQAYVEKTNRRVTLEYIMMADINDGPEALNALLSFCDKLLCHVNLIPVNSIEGSALQPSSKKTIDHWIEALQRRGTETTLRDSRGADIAGACGQLKSSHSS